MHFITYTQRNSIPLSLPPVSYFKSLDLVTYSILVSYPPSLNTQTHTLGPFVEDTPIWGWIGSRVNRDWAAGTKVEEEEVDFLLMQRRLEDSSVQMLEWVSTWSPSNSEWEICCHMSMKMILKCPLATISIKAPFVCASANGENIITYISPYCTCIQTLEICGASWVKDRHFF